MLFETNGNVDSPLDRKIFHAECDYGRACDIIKTLKCGINSYCDYVTPTLENISYSTNLPRIELICQNAKKAYFNALNRKGRADNFDNVMAVYCTSTVYIEAVNKRNQLLNQLKLARLEKKRSEQRLRDLRKLKAEQPADK